MLHIAVTWHTLPNFEVCALTAAKGVSLGSESMVDSLQRQAPVRGSVFTQCVWCIPICLVFDVVEDRCDLKNTASDVSIVVLANCTFKSF